MRGREAGDSARLQRIGEVALGVAHDLNNLLTALLNTADLVLARPETDALTQEDVAQMRASAERGARLLRRMSSVAHPHAEAVALDAAIESIAPLIERLVGPRIVVAVETATPGPALRIHPVDLDRLLINLASNARDAMREGGRLTLRGGWHTLASDEAALPAGRYAAIEVVDTGCGIPEALLASLFERGFTTRGGRGGTGLGLAIVQDLVRRAGGAIAVESEVGRGACFRILLPAAEGGVSAPPPPPPAEAVTHVKAGTLLLVEDDAILCRLVERGLALAGWRVLAAESADAALELLDDAAPTDLAAVVTDLELPGMDGAALITALRGRWPGLPALVVSGFSEEDAYGVAEAARIAYLVKPYTMAELREAVVRLVGARGETG